jgi:predicted small integral membrane protein
MHDLTVRAIIRTMPAEDAAPQEAAANYFPGAPTNVEDESPELRQPVTFSPLFWLGLLLALGMVVPFLPAPNYMVAVVGTVLFTVIYVIGVVQFAAHATRMAMSLPRLLLWLGLSLALWAALQWLIVPAIMAPLAEAAQGARPRLTRAQMFPLMSVEALANIAFLSAAVTGGALVGSLIKSPNMLGPICAMVALIDIWGVLFGGIVSQLMEKAPEVAAVATKATPTASAEAVARYGIQPLSIGAGDYLFLGLLFAALHFNHMNWRGAIALTAPLIALALLVLTLVPGVPHLPGLLFIGLGVALPNLKYFEYTREEKFALLYAAIFVAVLSVALYFGMVSILPDKPSK